MFAQLSKYTQLQMDKFDTAWYHLIDSFCLNIHFTPTLLYVDRLDGHKKMDTSDAKNCIMWTVHGLSWNGDADVYSGLTAQGSVKGWGNYHVGLGLG